MHRLSLVASGLVVGLAAAPASATQEPAKGPATLIAPGTPAPPKPAGTALGPFTRIQIAGDVDLNVHGDAKGASAEIDCPTRQGPGVQLVEQGQELMVTPMHEGERTGDRCVVTVHTSGLQALQIAGASKVRGGALATLSSVEVGGAANLDLRGLAAASFELTVAGAGKARLAGTVGEVKLVIAGAADIDARDLTAQTGHLTTQGAGNIRATVKSEVHATTAGAGLITVYGKPAKVHPTTMGVGRVELK